MKIFNFKMLHIYEIILHISLVYNRNFIFQRCDQNLFHGVNNTKTFVGSYLNKLCIDFIFTFSIEGYRGFCLLG